MASKNEYIGKSTSQLSMSKLQKLWIAMHRDKLKLWYWTANKMPQFDWESFMQEKDF